MFSLLKKPVRTGARPLKSSQRNVVVAGRSIPLTVKENHRATRITLRIEPGGRALRMTVPSGLRHMEVDDFLDRHQGWLESKLTTIPTDKAIVDGGMIDLRGVPHRIRHTGGLRGLTEAVVVDGVPVLNVSGLPDHMGRRIATYLKKEARKDLEAGAARHAAAIRKPIKSVSMKDTRSRWGSCSWEGNLSFSWRIVMAPPFVIDYLAAHEVAHLKEMNHGADFWTLCEKLCPRTEEARRWLKAHGSQLHAIDFE